MRFEIEQKFRTRDHAAVIARLEAMGVREGPRVEQSDAYLSHPCRDFAATNEAFRLRSDGPRNAVTYKGPKREGPTKTREEIEVPFQEGREELAALRRVFEALGFREVAVVRKGRTPYHVNRDGRDLEVVLDVVDDLGTFVEVETIAVGEADVAAAQRTVLDLAAELGLTELEPRSYLRMLLESREAAADG